MKTSDQVTSAKLRGGFYSPDELVTLCLDRVSQVLPASSDELIILEPSAGDGAFIRGLGSHSLANKAREIIAVEINPEEASLCRQSLAKAKIAGTVQTGSLLTVRNALPIVDVALGNPPFVRFQFVDEADRRDALHLASELGVSLAGVSNLWIPLLLASLNKIRDDGAFAFIVPFECFTGISAKLVRDWLLDNVCELQVDVFAARSFPNVLQEVVVLSGSIKRGTNATKQLTVKDHAVSRSWTHIASRDTPTWTGYLLAPRHLEAVATSRLNPSIHRFGDVARLTVATVTGANDYFCFTDDKGDEYELLEWRLPLLARIRHASGLRYTDADFKEALNQGLPRWILDVDIPTTSLARYPGLARYVAEGEAQALHERYKCRIREPWYKVPIVQSGRLLLSKRSHRFPRLVLNDIGAITTDTIYQGQLFAKWRGNEESLVAGFHNSLTLLSAEIEGRSFGGGVLELVPSEVARLLVPMAADMQADLESLDLLARSDGVDAEDLISSTDELLAKYRVLDKDLIDDLQDARRTLLVRRLGRNH